MAILTNSILISGLITMRQDFSLKRLTVKRGQGIKVHGTRLNYRRKRRLHRHRQDNVLRRASNIALRDHGVEVIIVNLRRVNPRTRKGTIHRIVVDATTRRNSPRITVTRALGRLNITSASRASRRTLRHK